MSSRQVLKTCSRRLEVQQLLDNKWKYGIKNVIELTLNISSNLIGKSNDENNLPSKSLLTNTEVSRLYNGLWANIKLSKPQLHKIPLRLAAEASATDAAIHKKMFESCAITLIIFNEEMSDITKVVKYLE